MKVFRKRCFRIKSLFYEKKLEIFGKAIYYYQAKQTAKIINENWMKINKKYL